METRKFITECAEEAAEQIRTELGPNAVVLDVRKLPRRPWAKQRFEITATVPETERPSDPFLELREEVRELRQTMAHSGPANALLVPFLVQTGLLPRIAESIAKEVDSGLSLQEQIESAREILRSHWRATPVNNARYQVFVGPPGAGKSTVLCKALAQHILGENRSAAVLQLDAHIANLSPQPRYYAEILGAHFLRELEQEPQADTVFVDLPGIPLNDPKALETVREIIAGLPDACVHLVLTAPYETTLLMDQAQLFAALNPFDLILTRLDEEPRWGKLWNLVFGTNFSIGSLSVGQNVPGGLLQAEPDTLLRQQFGGKRPVLAHF